MHVAIYIQVVKKIEINTLLLVLCTFQILGLLGPSKNCRPRRNPFLNMRSDQGLHCKSSIVNVSNIGTGSSVKHRTHRYALLSAFIIADKKDNCPRLFKRRWGYQTAFGHRGIWDGD